MKTFLEHALSIASQKEAALLLAGNAAQARRVASAGVLLVDGEVEEVAEGRHYRVRGSELYDVRPGECQCPDHRSRRVASCRHRVAAYLHSEAKKAQRQEAEWLAGIAFCVWGIA